MQRERVADDIYVFTSELYAQVTAGAVITSEGAILIDTLVFPEEARAIKSFLETRLSCPVRYVINTHYHADHTYGTCFFEHAQVVSHAKCYDLLATRGLEGLTQAQQSTPELRDVRLVLPNLVFDAGVMSLHLGNKTLELWHSPGHSPDSIVCLVKEDRVLFAADTLMPVPYFVDGSYEDFIASLHALKNGAYENVVQGHGEVVLRGEVEEKIDADLDYLAHIRRYVEQLIAEQRPPDDLDALTIEDCGKSRIPLNGLVQDLHRGNLHALYHQLQTEWIHTL
ncbi:MBL fold metallo-hydrolase [Aggregatilinea lenta]|uniref:MBL fold metallo-hydrolase n=1 Tax=Aggregatilinea lenta TaxID=913108 RepID=UPI000E5C45A9|nr:MBL fold metallo-hydrolase [Aggregatilinea lenta]